MISLVPRGRQPSPGAATWQTPAVFIPTCSSLPHTVDCLQLLSLAGTAALIYWGTTHYKRRERQALLTGTSALPPFPCVMCPLSELECAGHEPALISRIWKSAPSSLLRGRNVNICAQRLNEEGGPHTLPLV